MDTAAVAVLDIAACFLQGNQTILGVMGSDVTTKEMESFTPWREVRAPADSLTLSGSFQQNHHTRLSNCDIWSLRVRACVLDGDSLDRLT